MQKKKVLVILLIGILCFMIIGIIVYANRGKANTPNEESMYEETTYEMIPDSEVIIDENPEHEHVYTPN